jgi:hypothetical protein
MVVRMRSTNFISSRPEEKRPGAWMDMYSTRWLKRDQLCLPVGK